MGILRLSGLVVLALGAMSLLSVSCAAPAPATTSAVASQTVSTQSPTSQSPATVTTAASAASPTTVPAAQPADSPTPGARWGEAMAYDPVSRTIIMFGGVHDEQFLGDTWALDPVTRTWTALKTSDSPNPRYGTTLVYDPETKEFILFGGEDADGDYADTWAFDPAAKAWTQLHPSASPLGRQGYSMVRDPASGKLILFGGNDYDYNDFSDTWAFDPATTVWKEIETFGHPSSRDSCAMAALGNSGKIVLFGGEALTPTGGDPNSTDWADTWVFEWATQDWKEVHTPAAPPARDSAQLVWDEKTGTALLFGGEIYSQSRSFGDTWAFDPATVTWKQIEAVGAPSPRDSFAMVHTDTPAGLVAYGGVQNGYTLEFAEVWSFDATQSRWLELLSGTSAPTA